MPEISDDEFERRFRETAAYTIAEDERLQAAVLYMLLGETASHHNPDYLDFDALLEHLEFHYGDDGDLLMWAFNICEKQVATEEAYFD